MGRSFGAFLSSARRWDEVRGFLANYFAVLKIHGGLQRAVRKPRPGQAVGLAVAHDDFFSDLAVFVPSAEHAVKLAVCDFSFGKFIAIPMPFDAEPVGDAFPEVFGHLNLTIGVPALRKAVKKSVGNCRSRPELSAGIAVEHEPRESIGFIASNEFAVAQMEFRAWDLKRRRVSILVSRRFVSRRPQAIDNDSRNDSNEECAQRDGFGGAWEVH